MVGDIACQHYTTKYIHDSTVGMQYLIGMVIRVSVEVRESTEMKYSMLKYLHNI